MIPSTNVLALLFDGWTLVRSEHAKYIQPDEYKGDLTELSLKIRTVEVLHFWGFARTAGYKRLRTAVADL